MSNQSIRYLGVGPSTDAFPLSGATASSVAILITGTTAAGQTTVHTCDANAWDSPYIRLDNVGSTTVTVYGNIGSTATTGNRQFSITAGSFAIAFSYDVMMSNSGVFGFWATATSGIYAAGLISRFYTSSSQG